MKSWGEKKRYTDKEKRHWVKVFLKRKKKMPSLTVQAYAVGSGLHPNSFRVWLKKYKEEI